MSRSIVVKEAERNSEVSLLPSDPFLNLLCWIFPRRTLLRSMAVPLVFGIPPVISSMLEGVFRNSAIHPDLSHDIGFWTINLIVPPLGLSFVYGFEKTINSVVNELFDGNLLLLSIYDLNNIILSCRDRVLVRLAKWLPYLLAPVLCYFVFSYFMNPSRDSWFWPAVNRAPTITCYLTMPSATISALVAFIIVLRFPVGCYVINRILAGPLDIHVLHPDRSGGFGIVGRVAIITNLLVLIAGIIILGVLYSDVSAYKLPIYNPFNLLMLFGYFTASALMVFLPIVPIHRRMNRERAKFISQIDLAFHGTIGRVREAVSKDLLVEDRDLKQLDGLRKIYDMASQQPVWPFNYKLIIGFISSIAPPSLFSLLWPAIRMLVTRL